MTPFECWDAGGGEVYVYTESKEQFDFLSDEHKPIAWYSGHNRLIGWQFKIPSTRIPLLTQKFKLQLEQINERMSA